MEEDSQPRSKGKVTSLRKQAPQKTPTSRNMIFNNSEPSSSKMPSSSTSHPTLGKCLAVRKFSFSSNPFADNIKGKMLSKLTPVHRRATKIADEALEPPMVEKTIGKNPFIRKSNGKK